MRTAAKYSNRTNRCPPVPPSELACGLDARKWAATVWYNDDYNLKKVKIAPDAWNTIADLEWQDDTRKDVSWVAQWRGRSGAD
ncbi:hypothetical protein ACGFR8_22995 [Streptomyces brevispora]|uniref:hypothetical protein n=1 Tax=Streptomyces brevispora TaxID=887462 RepID=UPI0037128838